MWSIIRIQVIRIHYYFSFMKMAEKRGLSLGIDLGTTSIKISLVDVDTERLVFSTSEPTEADIPNDVHCDWAEQDVNKILAALCSCLMRITEKNRSIIQCISISGQMHCVLLWNCEDQAHLGEHDIQACSSSLFTWEDKRANKEFLSNLPKPDSHQGISTGFGCVTLFWLMKNCPEMLVKYDTSGGIMDYVVTLLCGLDKPVMSNQMAASWGYYDTEYNSWNFEILKQANFPVHMLPVVVEGGTKVGGLCREWFGIKQGTPVLVGVGDLQCSFLSAIKTETDAVMNISTSSQVCYPVSCQGFVPSRSDAPTPVKFFPYFKGTYLAVAASMNGGNVLKVFVKMIQQWLQTFGFELTQAQVWEKLTDISTSCKVPTSVMPIIQPLLYGERHDPEVLASVTSIQENGLSLDCVFKSLCTGLVANLYHMMPQSVLIESGMTRLVVTGSVIHRQPFVRDRIRELYEPLPVEEKSDTDASFGAAIVGIKYLTND